MISNEIKSNEARTRRRIPKGGFEGSATMKLSVLTLALVSSVRGNGWINQETTNVSPSTGVPIVEVRPNSPVLSTSILPPRGDPIQLTRLSASISNRNDKMEPIVVDSHAIYGAPNSAIMISPQSRTTSYELPTDATRLTGGTSGNANIERNGEITSDNNTSKKLFLCGSIGDELIVSRPESGSVFIKGASRVAIIEDVQNSVIVCPPGANLSPPPTPEENTGTQGPNLERRLPTKMLPPTVLITESSKISPSVDPPIELKDYLVPPYSYWQK